ncbi:MAG: hypothetical protein JST16_04580 [Bdellovibrionales bacterium]|nr:hypothetical protein [Bdellovibrionales bacterium]
MSDKTEAQLAAEKAAAAAKKSEEKAAAKAAKELAKAEEKARKEAAKEAEKAAKEAEKAAKVKEKEDAVAAAKAAKEASKMPEANGVRRPKPETLCGRAWSVFDEVSAKNGAPASIKESLEIAKARGLNEGNVRVEYARWRKFFGIAGRVQAPNEVKAESTAE